MERRARNRRAIRRRWIRSIRKRQLDVWSLDELVGRRQVPALDVAWLDERFLELVLSVDHLVCLHGHADCDERVYD